jgi:RHS repeat-associated protein
VTVGKKLNGVLQSGWLYEGTRPIAELNETGTVVARFVYGTRPHVPDMLWKDGILYRLVSDERGSVRLVVNAKTGAVAQRLDYDVWGNVTADTAPAFQPFAYAGGLWDASTRLVRFGARDYDPETGRWTAKDPLRFASGDTNLYAYVSNDPVNLIDPSGQIPDSIRAGVLTRLAAGDIIGAGDYYLLATGASQLPRWFVALQQAFSAANQVAGRCEATAEAIAEGLRRLGQNPQIINISSTGGRFLSWQGRVMVSDNNFHQAVMVGERIIDAHTGSAGLTWIEYQAQLQHAGTLLYKVAR